MRLHRNPDIALAVTMESFVVFLNLSTETTEKAHAYDKTTPMVVVQSACCV